MSSFDQLQLRVGNGFDVHAFAPDRPLILGSVRIPHSVGLAGHSDADVLLHAITDAVLGALGWGDIGNWFPDTDEQYRDIDSSLLFGRVWQKASAEGWRLVNCDSVVLAQQPKLAPHIADIGAAIARLFDTSSERVNVKATTTERLGFIGRSEGMAASATVLLQKVG